MASSNMSPELAQAIIASAQRLGINPLHLGTAISYETGGKFDPDLMGGKGGNYQGLIQFGPEERAKYGVKQGQSGPEQMQAVESFLRDRGVKPGMGLMDVYSTINAGAPGLYNRSDAANGGAPGTVADKVNNQMSDHAVNAAKLLGINGPVGALDAAAAPAVQPGPPTVLPSSPDAPPAVPSNALANLATAMGGGAQQQGATPAQPAAPDFAPLQQIQMAQPQIGQSQQIAAALAKAYGIGA